MIMHVPDSTSHIVRDLLVDPVQGAIIVFGTVVIGVVLTYIGFNFVFRPVVNMYYALWYPVVVDLNRGEDGEIAPVPQVPFIGVWSTLMEMWGDSCVFCGIRIHNPYAP